LRHGPAARILGAMTLRIPTRLRAIVAAVAIALCLPVPITAHSQAVKLDVKTTVAEKRALGIAKAGLIAALKNSNWAQVVEFGEDRAVWLKRLERSQSGTVVTLSVDLEIREPRAIGEGRLVSSRRVTASYDTAFANGLTDAERRARLDLESERMMQALAVGLAAGTMRLVIPEVGNRLLIKRVTDNVAADLERPPTIEEVVESMAVGASTLQALRAMLSSR
jgi:hypothetical protein